MVVTASAALTPTTITLTSVTAFAAVLLGFLTTILGFLNQRKIKATAGKVDTISVNVDGRLTEQVDKVAELFTRQDTLMGAIRELGAKVPGVPVEPVPLGSARPLPGAIP